MEHDQTKDRSYWHLLDDAERALAAGDYPGAERWFQAAEARREGSPGRVFVTESLADGLRRLLRRRDAAAPPDPGRWERRAGAFRAAFLSGGERIVRDGVRLAELRPEDDADANQPALATALYLVVRSRLFPEELPSAVPLLKGLFRTSARTGRPFDVDLIRHDLPLTEEDRLWLARRGGDLLETFLEHGHLTRGTGPAGEWAAAVLQLLHPRYFGTSSRLAEERAWLEAVSADRLQGEAAASVGLYRAYLQASPGTGPRSDEARVRILELMANIDGCHLPVPRYDEALGALQSAGLAPGSEQAARYNLAVARIEHRRPDPEPGATAGAWASAALGPDGSVCVVSWWRGEPRDVAWWRPGDEVGPLDSFLEPCEGSIVARDAATIAAAAGAWETGPAEWPIGQFVEALAEPEIARSGDGDRSVLAALAAGELGPWRAGWRRDVSRPELRPPTDAEALASGASGLERALLAGLAVLGLRNRVGGSEPALRAGLAELARRGDRAARRLYALLTTGDDVARATDAAFAAWTVPLLWTRADPFVRERVRAGGETAAAVGPELGRNDVVIASTGDPAGVLAAWGGERGRWRIVLDRMDRLAALVPALGALAGPVTVIPRGGTVHRLDDALDLLEALVRPKADASDPEGGLLAVFHWVRLVTTHNGDLLDFADVRPRERGAVPLYDRYAGLVAGLPRECPRLAQDPDDDGWAAQFGQRARKAGFLAGHADLLDEAAGDLDALWGVFEGSDASWTFLDAAAVRLRLAGPGGSGLAAVHARLLPRGHRHLSVLTGAVWCRDDLEDLLAEELAPYGAAYRLALADVAPPELRLVDRGAHPGSCLAAEHLAACLAHVGDGGDGRSRQVLLPQDDHARAFWQAARDGRFPVAGQGWQPLELPEAGQGARPGAVLSVPILAGLFAPPAAQGDHAAWLRADGRRDEAVTLMRRRCALEIAAHLAGGWSAVEILDGRWWLLLRDTLAASAGAAAADGVRAAQEAAPGFATTFDLPESAGDARRRLAPDLAGSVAAWGAGRGLADTAQAAKGWPAAGRHLRVGAGSGAAAALLAAVASEWARGRAARWSLVVAAEAPPGAAEVAAAATAAGASAWPAAGRAPAPVVWARPADVLEPGFVAFIERHGPSAVYVPDLELWLPDPERGAQAEAAALRAVLALPCAALLVEASSLAQAWRTFLADATGLEVTPAAPVGAPAPVPAADAPPSATLVTRMQALLRHLRPLPDERPADAGRGHADLDGELVPLARLAVLAGLGAETVSEAVRVLRWVGRLAGDHLSAAESAAPGRDGTPSHTLLFPEPFAAVEKRLEALADGLDLLLPLVLGRVSVGGATWLDLDQPPVKLEPGLLATIDTWLLGCEARERGLAVTAPRGVLASSRRLLCLERPLDQVRQGLHADLELFRRRVHDVLAAAVETGEGFRVDTGLSELRDDERAFLGLGAALGYWRWLGPAGPGVLPLVDLLSLADSPTVLAREEGWSLVGALGGGPAAPSHSTVAVSASHRGGLRGLLGGGDQDVPDAVAGRVAALVGDGSAPGMIVLKGPAGSGRLSALLRGLEMARATASDAGDVVVHCPDAAAAAAVARRAVAAGLALDLRLPVPGDLPEASAPKAGAPAASGRNDVVVMTEIQRFGPEVRYRIAQHGRGRRLLMTVDPVATGEAWENLFLTTPRAADVCAMDGQRDQARRLWEQVRGLVPGAGQESLRSLRRERGLITAEYAANLDQAVMRIVQAREKDELPGRLRLSAPLAADLQFLAGALREHGWLAVDEEALDALALPGPCDLLAAAADLLQAAGSLRGRGAPQPAAETVAAGAGAADAVAARSDGGAEAGSHLEPLLPALPRDDALPDGAWPPAQPGDPSTLSLAEVAAHLLARPALAPALRQPAARRRVDALLGRWGERSLQDLADDPLWQAWRTTLCLDLGRPDPAPGRPLVLLNPADRTPGGPVAGAAHLCLGGEDPRQHYRVLVRAADALLILYQERSPLPGG